jgi:signal transduction histidine kinase
MFYRVSEKSIGSGLGLYIVKEAVDKLKGRIGLRSEPGKGTEFSIEIPNIAQ